MKIDVNKPTLIRQLCDLKRATNAIVAHQFKLPPDLLQAAINLQTEMYRLDHMARQMLEGKYRPERKSAPAPKKRKLHPSLLPHIKTLTAAQGTPVAPAATALLEALLRIFDEGEQAKWQLRDLLQRRERLDANYQPTHYLSLKYGATEMVYRIACASGMGLDEVTYFSNEQPPELANWKSEQV